MVDHALKTPSGAPGAGAPGQMIQPPSLKARFGARMARIDPDAIAKAEAALKGLSSQFGQWLQDEVDKIEAARSELRSQGKSQPALDRVYGHAHDLKGLGATYEFPLITRIAGSLCKLLGEPSERLKAPVSLVDAHVDAIRACVRENIRDDENPKGRLLAEELEQGVATVLAAS